MRSEVLDEITASRFILSKNFILNFEIVTQSKIDI